MFARKRRFDSMLRFAPARVGIKIALAARCIVATSMAIGCDARYKPMVMRLPIDRLHRLRSKPPVRRIGTMSQHRESSEALKEIHGSKRPESH